MQLHAPKLTDLDRPPVGCCALPAFCEILWASKGESRHAPRASTCNLPQILCRTSACPGFCIHHCS